MMKTRCVIFDLDGTLLDTSPGILECIVYASEKLGYPGLTQDQLLGFIGPPLQQSFMRCYGCTEDEASKLTDAFREHYREGALFHARPYEGIIGLCQMLHDEDIQLAVATSKLQVFAEQILRHFGFSEYISVVHGADAGAKATKAELIRRCIEDAGVSASECVMVGDTEYDASGAYEAGVGFIAVTYGFGSQGEMMQFPCIGIADKPTEISNLVVSRDSKR